MAAHWKEHIYRNERLLDLCRGQRCWLEVPRVCTGNAGTVVPCHSPDLECMHGKAASVKAHDIFSVPGCQDCHDWLDGRGWVPPADARERQEVFNRAHARWLIYLITNGIFQFNPRGIKI